MTKEMLSTKSRITRISLIAKPMQQHKRSELVRVNKKEKICE